MTTIGTFTPEHNGYTGNVHTLTLNTEVTLAPASKENANAPDYRVYAGELEIGAAWRKTSKAKRPYSIDDPSFPAPVYASLVENQDGAHHLIWSRSKPE